tara:strand:- start:4890 stop:5159 length:270 start_codon:yes stop_codon:yes gene_type:complete
MDIVGYFYEDVCQEPMDYTDYVVIELQDMDFNSEEIDEYMAGDYGLDADNWEDEYNNEYIPSMTCERIYNWLNIGIAGIGIFVLYNKLK